MKLIVDAQEITIPDELLEDIWGDIWTQLEQGYSNMDETVRFAMKMLIRQFLKSLEKQYGTDIRPPKGDDPVMHFMSLILNFTMEVAKRHASVEVRTDESRHSVASSCAVAIESEGQSWRQVVNHRSDGLRENNLLEEATSASLEVVP